MAIKIQREVRKHLAAKRVTMNRTRCVRFYWQRFCRLAKYYASVNAARCIKRILKEKVTLIERQYIVFRFRKQIKTHLQNKYAKVIQYILRKVLQRNKHEFYLARIQQIKTIQSGFKMFKAIKVARRLAKIRDHQEKQATRFQRTYQMLFNHKPSSKRKQRMNKLMQDHKKLLEKERILDHKGVQISNIIGSEPIDKTSKLGIRVQMTANRGSQMSNYSNPEELKQQYLYQERRDRTMKALRYIEKYKHLYKVQKPNEKYNIVGIQQAEDQERNNSKQTQRPLKGKFDQNNPKVSSYANPNYKPGTFEQYYKKELVQKKKQKQQESSSVDRQSETFLAKALQKELAQFGCQVKKFNHQQFCQQVGPFKPSTQVSAKKEFDIQQNTARLVDTKLYQPDSKPKKSKSYFERSGTSTHKIGKELKPLKDEVSSKFGETMDIWKKQQAFLQKIVPTPSNPYMGNTGENIIKNHFRNIEPVLKKQENEGHLSYRNNNLDQSFSDAKSLFNQTEKYTIVSASSKRTHSRKEDARLPTIENKSTNLSLYMDVRTRTKKEQNLLENSNKARHRILDTLEIQNKISNNIQRIKQIKSQIGHSGGNLSNMTNTTASMSLLKCDSPKMQSSSYEQNTHSPGSSNQRLRMLQNLHTRHSIVDSSDQTGIRVISREVNQPHEFGTLLDSYNQATAIMTQKQAKMLKGSILKQQQIIQNQMKIEQTVLEQREILFKSRLRQTAQSKSKDVKLLGNMYGIARR